LTVAGIARDGDNSSTSIRGQLSPPYSIELANGNKLAVNGAGYTTVTAADGTLLHEQPDGTAVTAMVPIDDGRWNSVASTLLVLPLFGVAWVGLYQLWRVVQSARDGDPFTIRNVTRLRWVAGCIAVAPVLGWLVALGMNQVLADDMNARMSMGPGWGFWLAVAVGVVAIAEVIRRGVDLRDLTEHTI
jgi:hypothetical protein